ncbi:alpha-galactosidase [Terrabacter sp. MAHUQ-38]|nr:alpha-galactosidase [Terrabacter sp. MAHUQ-38]
MRLRLTIDDHSVRVRSVGLDNAEVASSERPLPLVEVGVVGAGRTWSARRYIDSVASGRSRYVNHSVSSSAGGGETLTVTTADDVTGLRATTRLTASPSGAAIRVETTLSNDGLHSVDVAWVTSAVLGGLFGRDGLGSAQLWSADNDWLAEYRWAGADARALLPDVNRAAHEHDPRGAFTRTAVGAWSTDGSLPVGVAVDPATGRSVGWQVEHNGAWLWQVGERSSELYLSALGPTQAEHDWGLRLEPGDQFTTVPATLVLSLDGFEGAIAELTRARRDLRRPHEDHTRLPVIFNDYMNTLMGDPTTAKLLPLIEAAAAAGAEIFCIDAGWYDDDAEGWWDSVGAWEPAQGRFPDGIDEVLAYIRDKGMTPGLWLEPEVVGVRSAVAETLPDEAFFMRHGRRVVEHGRYHLDLRHPLARKHLDGAVDRLVEGLGVGYFKLDHNINPGSGTDHDALSAGSGLLGHNRAHLEWLDGVLDRHPHVTIENCASGGMRVDYAMLARLQVQSTSDQQDPLRYPPIAAAAPTAMTPEQAASWAYPQPDYSDDLNAFTLNTGLLGRLQLSGHLDEMTDAQRALVTDAVSVHKELRRTIPAARPFWPLGLPGWEDEWVALGLEHEDETLVTVWRRHGEDPTRTLRIPGLAQQSLVVPVFPRRSDVQRHLTTVDGEAQLEVTLPRAPQAVTLRVHHPRRA